MSKPTVKVIWHGPAWMEKFMKGVERNMDAAAIYLQNTIKENISTGQPPSDEGEFPHVKTGHLRRSIGWDRTGPARRKVGVNIGNG